jgi:hypothetical protein
LFCSDDCRSWPREEKINNLDAEVRTHAFLIMIIEESVSEMSCESIFLQLFSCGTHGIYLLFFLINWTLRMSDNLPERVLILCHAHILCITVRDNIIICCQIFCDLLLKSAFERIFNVMQLILVKIKWHIKWKYLIQNSSIFAFHVTLNSMDDSFDINGASYIVLALEVCLFNPIKKAPIFKLVNTNCRPWNKQGFADCMESLFVYFL